MATLDARIAALLTNKSVKFEEKKMMGGRTMKGYITVAAEGVKTAKQLESWVQTCLDFNPMAKSSKKK